MRFFVSILMPVLCLAAGQADAFDWLASGNPSNDKLLRMTDSQQAEVLSRATHGGCMAQKQFYMGTEKRPPNQNVSFWSFYCSNVGGSFMVAIAPDATGSTRVFSCNLMRGHPWTCFEKLPDLK